jgi:hypothetical protein
MHLAPSPVQQLAQAQRRQAEHEDRGPKLRVLALGQQEPELLDAKEPVAPWRLAELMDRPHRVHVISPVLHRLVEDRLSRS